VDRLKTGALIAGARKEKNMTQRALAEALHVSDRAVSKWERGAGFPDVSLLEPLAEALSLTVLDLLRGERVEETNVDAAVREALSALEEKRRRDRRELWDGLGKGALLLLIIAAILSFMFPYRKSVCHTVTAGVYVDGALAAYTEVEIDGVIENSWHKLLLGKKGGYWGRFAIGCVEWTTREKANAGIYLGGEDGLTYSMGGTSTMDFYDVHTVISPDVTEFAMALQSPNHLVSGQPRAEQWCILATSPELYEQYCARMGNPPPLLTADKTAPLPEFPSAWNRNLR